MPICHLRGEPSTYSSQNTPPLTSVRNFSLHHYCAAALLRLSIPTLDPTMNGSGESEFPNRCDGLCAERGLHPIRQTVSAELRPGRLQRIPQTASAYSVWQSELMKRTGGRNVAARFG